MCLYHPSHLRPSFVAHPSPYRYDVTDFAEAHPGGLASMRMVAGQDATTQFNALHTQSVIQKYHDKLCVGVMEVCSSLVVQA
jgi:cytochrome b involved in lipid metabolism